jgi:hypothetical protein
MLVASTSVFGFNCTLFPPPALDERRHRGLEGSQPRCSPRRAVAQWRGWIVSSVV